MAIHFGTHLIVANTNHFMLDKIYSQLNQRKIGYDIAPNHRKETVIKTHVLPLQSSKRRTEIEALMAVQDRLDVCHRDAYAELGKTITQMSQDFYDENRVNPTNPKGPDRSEDGHLVYRIGEDVHTRCILVSA